MVYTVSFVLLLIFYLQGLPLFREKKWSELAVFMLLLSLAGYMMYAQALGFHVPNPSKFITTITERFSSLIFH
jgi:hypothetical protein